VLFRAENLAMLPETEFLLFSASRAQLVREVIAPHLDSGGMVVCDRFFHSSLAYQGYGHDLDLEALSAVTSFATGDLRPDLVLLLDVPVERGLQRRRQEGGWNRLDAYELGFHRRVRQGYLTMAERESDRWVLIDATHAPDQVERQIRDQVEARLAKAAQ
jgi:dTMP kinase